jgi:glycine cleavage system transcriptional repressor
MSFVAITAVGQDRPGIVAEVTGVLFRQGCNLEDSTMTRLRDQFAMLLVVDVPEDAYVALDTALQLVASRLGLSLIVRPLGLELAAAEETGETYMLRVYGADRPGIVHAVTAELAQRGWNVADLNTRLLAGGNGPAYVLMLEVEAPGPDAAAALEPELARLRETLGVEISLEQLDPEAL